jgi:archaellum component FlaG (FlaF/FlaG flagellin family)
MRRRLLILCAAFVLVAAGCGGSKTTTATVDQTRTVVHTVTETAPPPNAAALCSGSDLSVTFKAQPGSAGAGNIVYTLTVTNTSSATCRFDGWPNFVLLAQDGSVLPTKVVPVQGVNAPSADLVPGGSISYDGRFSPDVPGTGDKQSGACEPVATTLRLAAPGGGTVDGPISPPTSVCERGTITLRPATH